MSFVLLAIAGTLATTKPEAAAMIQGAAGAHVAESPIIARLFSLIVTENPGEEGTRELRDRGAEMYRDQPVTYTLTHTNPIPRRAQIRSHEQVGSGHGDFGPGG
jgi:hypothetical protein